MKKAKLQLYCNFSFAFLIIVGILRISSTYSVFWQTWDEPAHIAAGMEWLDRGQYTYELFHPPLARMMGALGLYFDGVRAVGKVSMYDEGNAILHTNGVYEHNLTLARLGILPFFTIASLVVALWANIYYGTYTAFLSVVLFTTLPAILAHSGLATLDMACATLVTAALLALCLWLDRPTLLRSHLLGITVGLAVLAKFSSLGFLIASGGLIGALYGFRFFKKASIENGDLLRVRQWITASVVAVLVCFVVIWAGYRFSSSYLLEVKDRPYEEIDLVVGTKGLLHDFVYFVVENVPIPAPEFREGITQVFKRDKKGQTAYLLGGIRTHGWWYFYPLVLLLKTPLPFVFLTITGSSFGFRYFITQQGDHRVITPVVAAIGVLVVSMQSSVNNGTRQILAIYPLLAIVAGYGAAKLQLYRHRYVGLILIIVLLFWQITSSFAAHPNYIAYFNELAGRHLEEIVVDSDLDWGQDLKRLATTLKKRGVKELALSYNGSNDLDRFDLPERQELVPYQKTSGWIAISVLRLQLGIVKPPYDQYSWPKEYQPVEKVGKSIWLYYIPQG